MRGPFRIRGYAIASADGMIADGTGKYPKCLRFDVDQQFFLESLEPAAVIVQGRNSGESQPGSRKRLRLIMTRKIASLTPQPDDPNARFWNPAGASLEEACAAVGCTSGTVAVIGGPDVYSYFLQIGYDDFYLSRAENVYLPGGKSLFPPSRFGRKPEEVLASAGLKPGITRPLADGVSLIDWKPAAQLIVANGPSGLEQVLASLPPDAPVQRCTSPPWRSGAGRLRTDRHAQGRRMAASPRSYPTRSATSPHDRIG